MRMPCSQPGIVHAVRFGIGDVNLALVVERDAARRAELRPCREVLALLIEELDAVVVAVGDEDAALHVDGDAVQRAELARRVAGLAPRLDELAVLENFTRGCCRSARGRRRRRCRRSRRPRRSSASGSGARRCRHARFAERHQHLALRAELDDLVSGLHARFGRHRDAPASSRHRSPIRCLRDRHAARAAR